MKPTEYQNINRDFIKNKKLSVLMPFYNEEKNIVKNTHKVIETLNKYNLDYEIVLCDDGSVDNGYEKLKNEFKDNKSVIIVRTIRNFGKGFAIKTAYEYSSGDFILFLDSDLELSPQHLPNFFRIMEEENSDVVIGSKLHKDSILFYPLKRRIISLIYYTFIKIFFELPIMDTQTGIKLFKREYLEKALPKVMVKKFAFDIELLLVLHKLKAKISSAPIELIFSRGRFGNIKISTFYNTLNDTLAVLYRDKILKFYDRTLGENVLYNYTIVIFNTNNYDDNIVLDKLNKYLLLNYSHYKILFITDKSYNITNDKYEEYITNEKNHLKIIHSLLKERKLESNYIFFTDLSMYPDERLFVGIGRILSIDNVIGACGYFIADKNSNRFQILSQQILESIFISFNLTYRYKPLHIKNIGLILEYGFVIKKDILEELDFNQNDNFLLTISKHIKAKKYLLTYTPDIIFYYDYPRDVFELIRLFYSKTKRRLNIQKVIKLNLIFKLVPLMPLLILLFLIFSIAFKWDRLYFIPLVYYSCIFIYELVFYRLKGIVLTLWIIILEIMYSLFYIINFIKIKFKRGDNESNNSIT